MLMCVHVVGLRQRNRSIQGSATGTTFIIIIIFYREETESTAQKRHKLRPLVLPVKADCGRIEHWEVNEVK